MERHEGTGTKGLARRDWHEGTGTKGLARRNWHEGTGAIRYIRAIGPANADKATPIAKARNDSRVMTNTDGTGEARR